MISGIYKLTFPNGKTYVGQSWDIERRWYLYSIARTQSPKLKNALVKYSFDDIEKEIIEEVDATQEVMDKREIYWIKEINSIENGYNLQEGGRGGHHSQESIEKMRKANKGKRYSPDTEFKKGHRLTPEQQERASRKCSETKKGVPITESHKQALMKLKNLSEETKKKHKERYQGKTWKLIDGKRV